jgi:hypothetical protein
MKKIAILTILFALVFPLFGAYLTNIPITVNQLDGTKLELFTSGD